MPAASAITFYFSSLSALAAVIVGRNERGTLWCYACSSLLSDVLALGLQQAGLNPAGVMNLFILLQTLLVTWYVINHASNERLKLRVKVLTVVMSICFVAVTIPKWGCEVNFKGAGISYAAMIILMLWSFYYIIREVEVQKIERSPMFIFSAAFLLYLSGCIIIFLFREHMSQLHEKRFRDELNIVNHVLNSVKNAAVAYSLYLNGKVRSLP